VLQLTPERPADSLAECTAFSAPPNRPAGSRYDRPPQLDRVDRDQRGLHAVVLGIAPGVGRRALQGEAAAQLGDEALASAPLISALDWLMYW
jgi:hypothetical protein